MTLTSDIERVVAEADFGEASARKSGRNPQWPYVPVIRWTDDTGRTHDRQVLIRAYATRDEAVEAARRNIEAQRADLASKLADPRYRALRERYGLPKEIQS